MDNMKKRPVKIPPGVFCFFKSLEAFTGKSRLAGREHYNTSGASRLR